MMNLYFYQPWCSIYKKKAALLQVETDTHTYPKYRQVKFRFT